MLQKSWLASYRYPLCAQEESRLLTCSQDSMCMIGFTLPTQSQVHVLGRFTYGLQQVRLDKSTFYKRLSAVPRQFNVTGERRRIGRDSSHHLKESRTLSHSLIRKCLLNRNRRRCRFGLPLSRRMAMNDTWTIHLLSRKAKMIMQRHLLIHSLKNGHSNLI